MNVKKEIQELTFNNKRYWLFFYLLVYKIVLEILYFYIISPLYEYSGLVAKYNFSSFILSLILLVFITIFAPIKNNKPSMFIYLMIVIFIYMPTLTYFWMSDQNYNYICYFTFALIILSLSLKITISFPKIKDSFAKKIIFITYILFCLISVYLIYVRGGIDSRAFDFTTIYSLRSENNISGLNGYLLNWVTKALCTFLFVYFYYYKKYIHLFLIIALQLLMYLSYGNKAFLLSIGLLILVAIILRTGFFIKNIVITISLMHIIGFLLFKYTGFISLLSSISYRMAFVPAQIQFQYYDFFSLREKLKFADGIIGDVLGIESPYSTKIGYVIGSYYSTNGLGSNSNTGIFSDAYANGGFIAMILITLILALILVLIDSLTKDLPINIVIGALSYTILSMMDLSLLTVIFTGGLWILVLLLVLFNATIKPKEIV